MPISLKLSIKPINTLQSSLRSIYRGILTSSYSKTHLLFNYHLLLSARPISITLSTILLFPFHSLTLFSTLFHHSSPFYLFQPFHYIFHLNSSLYSLPFKTPPSEHPEPFKAFLCVLRQSKTSSPCSWSKRTCPSEPSSHPPSSTWCTCSSKTTRKMSKTPSSPIFLFYFPPNHF